MGQKTHEETSWKNTCICEGRTSKRMQRYSTSLVIREMQIKHKCDTDISLSYVYIHTHTHIYLSMNMCICMCYTGFPGGSVVKNLPANAGDTGSIPGLERSPGGQNGNPLQYSCLENPMDRGARRATVHGGHKELQLSDWGHAYNRDISVSHFMFNLHFPND